MNNAGTITILAQRQVPVWIKNGVASAHFRLRIFNEGGALDGQDTTDNFHNGKSLSVGLDEKGQGCCLIFAQYATSTLPCRGRKVPTEVKAAHRFALQSDQDFYRTPIRFVVQGRSNAKRNLIPEAIDIDFSSCSHHTEPDASPFSPFLQKLLEVNIDSSLIPWEGWDPTAKNGSPQLETALQPHLSATSNGCHCCKKRKVGPNFEHNTEEEKNAQSEKEAAFGWERVQAASDEESDGPSAKGSQLSRIRARDFQCTAQRDIRFAGTLTASEGVTFRSGGQCAIVDSRIVAGGDLMIQAEAECRILGSHIIAAGSITVNARSLTNGVRTPPPGFMLWAGDGAMEIGGLFNCGVIDFGGGG